MTTALPEPTQDGAWAPFPLVLGLNTFGDLIYDQAMVAEKQRHEQEDGTDKDRRTAA